ncbi:hypothetical protein QWY28_16375 [Nocardioides sp. SOB77]|uniref:Uncharacterized protein n=1 Tax=Nocardioides oceani TaxID=3058369 RepID=A0ABT8FIP0_9ACTN|nr:hypothetical protein [Nocardioides oceani]MDN4174538.1 hypothetical protein [Nocardioides oceani]
MSTAPQPIDDQVSTPYESWCERQGVHPEAPGAFDHYVSTLDAPIA